MKTLNYAKILLILTLLAGFTSCDKYYDDEYLQNSDKKLCGYTWMVEYDELDELITHSLKFDKDHSGKEVIEVLRRDNTGKWKPVNTTTHHFSWSWISDMEGLLLQYGAGDVSYFDNVWVRENYLSGTLDGEHVIFYRSDKH